MALVLRARELGSRLGAATGFKTLTDEFFTPSRFERWDRHSHTLRAFNYTSISW